jgi:hypothetical protein
MLGLKQIEHNRKDKAMRVTVRWNTETDSGRMPGKFGSVFEAEKAAKAFMEKYPTVIVCNTYHDTTGHVSEIKRNQLAT